MSERVKFGYAVRYRHDPRYSGLDRFLIVDGAESAKTNCFSLDNATIFYVDAEARRWLARFPTVGDPHMPDELRKAAVAAYLPGEVWEVWKETRLVVRGESFDDVNASLRLIRDALPKRADAAGVDAPAGCHVRGLAETLPAGG